jgi:hemolysin activation/secretion protein
MNSFVPYYDLPVTQVPGHMRRFVWTSGLGLVLVLGTAAPILAANPDAATDLQAQQSPAVKSTPVDQSPPRFFIKKYDIKGSAHLLPSLAIETAVYPYLGPYRTAADVEEARAALEKAYRDAGFQTVAVEIPAQQVRSGTIILEVVPNAVGRLRVTGSRYFSLDEIKREAPSLQEGAVPNFNDVTRDLVTLNQLADRQVTPALTAGRLPGTVDVDLNVKDSPPLHGSLEVNNRYSADTTPLRVNGSVSYDNLWQLGQTVGASFQIAPENPNDVKVFSGYYLAHVPGVDGLSLMLMGTKQDSDVSTLGGIGVAGRGDTVGLRAIFSLPPRTGFYHSVSLGFDYKHFEQDVLIAGTDTATPITYYPLSAAYSGTWLGQGYETDLNAAVNLGLRGLGSSEAEFDNNRHGADGNFIYFRGDLSHTRDLPEGFQVFGKVQGQVADQPLLNSEQFSGGGLGSVRGYLESEALGDNALLGSLELRTPSLGDWMGKAVDDWRVYVFGDGGILTINDPLLEQQQEFKLASVGAGTRVKFLNHVNGSLDAGVPLLAGVQTNPYDILLTFRVWAEF